MVFVLYVNHVVRKILKNIVKHIQKKILTMNTISNGESEIQIKCSVIVANGESEIQVITVNGMLGIQTITLITRKIELNPTPLIDLLVMLECEFGEFSKTILNRQQLLN